MNVSQEEKPRKKSWNRIEGEKFEHLEKQQVPDEAEGSKK